MPEYQVLFWDGPCAKQVKRITMAHPWSGPHPIGPDPTIRCGGASYHLFTSPWDEVLTYVVAGGALDHPPNQVRGLHDLFRAWNELMQVLSRRTERDLQRAHRAMARIKRAVR